FAAIASTRANKVLRLSSESASLRVSAQPNDPNSDQGESSGSSTVYVICSAPTDASTTSTPGIGSPRAEILPTARVKRPSWPSGHRYQYTAIVLARDCKSPAPS